jgi:hypothetical protein
MKPLPKPHKKAMLPSREAVNQLTKGGAQAQSLGNYAKLTPSGSGALTSYQSIIDQGYPKLK